MKNQKINTIIESLKTVYDPEFPMIDLYTLGLIYNIKINEKNKTINLLMTYTTPSCPMGEMLQQLCKNAINENFPQYTVEIEITFDPMRKISNIKDKDLQKLFK